MKASELKKLGVEIILDGTELPQYNRYAFKGITLEVSGSPGKIKPKALTAAIFKAGVAWNQSGGGAALRVDGNSDSDLDSTEDE